MKVKINNKIFYATIEGCAKVILDKGLNMNDILHFKQWKNKAENSTLAHQYKKDLHFATDTKRGLLSGCYPDVIIEDPKNTKVELSVDLIKYN